MAVGRGGELEEVRQTLPGWLAGTRAHLQRFRLVEPLAAHLGGVGVQQGLRRRQGAQGECWHGM